MILFVGERRSEKAKSMGVRWEDEALAAIPLFEGLRAIGIDPAKCRFVNWFEGGKKETRACYRWDTMPIVGLGLKVQAALSAEGIAHIALTHPAARGAIRRRDRYVAHVAEQLGGLYSIRTAAEIEAARRARKGLGAKQ